jgi:lipoprotein-anchoring transpeptidase ErfK/SrfK
MIGGLQGMFLREASILMAVATLGLSGSAAHNSAAAQNAPHPSSSLQDGYYLERLRKSGQNIPATGQAPANISASPQPEALPSGTSQYRLPDASSGAIDNRSPSQPSIVAPEPQIVSRPPGFGISDESNAADPAETDDDIIAPRPPSAIDSASPSQTPPSLPLQPGQTASQPSATPQPPANLAALPPEEQPEEGDPKELPPQFRRQIVAYQTKEAPGTIIIDTPSTFLYYVLGDGNAVRYGIGVGRDGFTWSGVERISRKAEWPDWNPPSEMIERQPYLPRWMAGGPGNPMGARALYLGKTVYRVHGTNQPSTIGKFVSSGCIRMLNEDVEDLYERAKVGGKVVVKAGARPASITPASASAATPAPGPAAPLVPPTPVTR